MTPKEKLDELKAVLQQDGDRLLLDDILNIVKNNAYDAGFVDAVTLYAIWNDGEQLVGTLRTPLKQALAKRKELYFYQPNLVDILPNE